MKKIYTFSTLCLIFFAHIMYAQDTLKPQVKEGTPFTPSGKVSTTVFTGFQTHTVGADVPQTGFVLDRAYLGYLYNASEALCGEVKLDVGNPSDISDSEVELKRRFMYVRTAYGKYKIDNTAILFGIINTNPYKLQETTWGYRYLYKSFMDQHKFSQSADLGISIEQKVNDVLTLDASITNGEGYTRLQSDKDFIYQLGGVFKPNKIVTVRLTGDYSNLHNKPITVGTFLSLHPTANLTLSAEYNIKMNYEGNEDHDLTGVSSYANYKFNDAFQVFVRYDNLQSTTLEGSENPWNYSKDGQAYIGGLEYSPSKQLKIAANYQNWIFDSTNKETKQLFGIFTELKF